MQDYRNSTAAIGSDNAGKIIILGDNHIPLSIKYSNLATIVIYPYKHTLWIVNNLGLQFFRDVVLTFRVSRLTTRSR